MSVTFDTKVKFEQHIALKIKKAYSNLGVIKRNFKNLSCNSFVNLYTALVRTHLEYAGCVWSPYRHGHIEDMEKVQMRATKFVDKIKQLPYEQTLKILGLPTLKHRRIRGDMIELYKMAHSLYNATSSLLRE